MNYEKPEVVELGAASNCIQGNVKLPGPLETQAPFMPTNGAYVADE
jgi:hypothetical protein